MTTDIRNNATNVNLGNPGYGGSTNFLVQTDYFISGNGYYPSGTGKTAIYSDTGGITLTSQTGASIVANNGAAQTSPTSAGGAGGIGVNLQASDSFFNSGTVKGGFGGSYQNDGGVPFSSIAPGGTGGAGVSLSDGAYLSNAGSITGGGGGGTFLSGGAGGSTLFLQTGQSAVGVEVAGGRATNSGSITGGGSQNSEVAGAAGVRLDSGATANYLNNTATGIIVGGTGANGGAGVNFVAYNKVAYQQSDSSYRVPGTIYNQGQITGGTSFAGVGGDGIDVAGGQGFGTYATNTDLDNIGTITGGNGSSGGGIGVNLAGNDLGYNGGTIQGGNATGSGANGGMGLSVNGGSLFISTGGTLQGGAGSGSGSGGAGVYMGGYGTATHLFDTTVTGGPGGDSRSMGDAVQFSSSGFAALGIYSGDTFNGQVAASTTAYDILSVAQSGTLTGGLGTQFTGFSELSFNQGTTWTVDATVAGVTNLTNVAGFTAGNSLDVTNLPNAYVVQPPAFTITGYNSATQSNPETENGTLAITTYNPNNSVTQTYDINFSYLGLGSSFQLNPDGPGGTDITLTATAACYLRGARIRTTRGEMPIEALSISDQVVCSSGNTRPVRWLGHRSIDCSRYPEPSSVWPICIRAGALSDQLPSRDLWVSPGHAVLVDRVLIQAEQLVNGVTVVRVPRERVEYWHVELDAHDVLFAEGLAAESYLDTGNRTAFVNGGAFLEAYPDFRTKHWSDTCMPLAIEGPELQQARARVLGRAQELGHSITNDTDVHVLADGDRIDPVMLGEKRMAFLIPASRQLIELHCRTFVPSHINAASRDGRKLGLCVGRLQVDGNDWPLDNDANCVEGWHSVEKFAPGCCHRWSSGNTPLPVGTRMVIIDVAGPSYYWQAPEQAVALCG